MIPEAFWTHHNLYIRPPNRGSHWAVRSAGRSPALQAGGRGFKSHTVHSLLTEGDTVAVQKNESLPGIQYSISVKQLGQYRFRDAIDFEVKYEDRSILLSNEAAHLFGCGTTVEDALKDLITEIDFSWHEYALEEDLSKLHVSAQRCRQWLLSNVEVLP